MKTMNKLDADVDKNTKPKNFVTDDGNVYILGNFDSTISTNVVPVLLTLINSLLTEKNPTINIYINSYGGEAKELFSMLSVIEMAKKQGIKIVTYVLGCAYSAGSLLAVFGDERHMSRYADHLLHLGSSGCSFTTFEQLKRETENNIKHFNKILDIYAAHTKIPKKKLAEMLKDDKLYLDPKQCLEYGICDFII
jgi:ATP-dependent protease ClpP protease subunit